MLVVCYAAKGGSGTSVIACSLAMLWADDSVLVDLDGDAPAALGLDAQDTQGVAEWTRADVGADALLDLAQRSGSTTVIPRGHGRFSDDPERWTLLTSWLQQFAGHAVVDAGTGDPPPALSESADQLVLVTRPCYLALARAARSSVRPTGVVLVVEPGRALSAADVERAVGAPTIASVPIDPAVARAVDAGLLRSRVPRHLARRLHRLLPSPAAAGV